MPRQRGPARAYRVPMTALARSPKTARPLVAAAVGSLCVAMVATGCTSAPPPAAPASTPAPVESASPDAEGEIASSGTPLADIQPWKAGPAPASDKTGPLTPTVWPTSIVEGSGSVTSTWPTLRIPDAKGEVDVEIVNLSKGGGFGADAQGEASEVAWTGTGKASGIELPSSPPVLDQGATYAYRARARGGDAKEWAGPWVFNVDRVRQGTAPQDSFGGVLVNMMSGLPATSWQSLSFTGPTSVLSLGLVYRPGTPATPGLPEGWTWTMPGLGLTQLIESETRAGSGDDEGPLSVRLAGPDGSGPTFVRTESGAYVPGLADGTATSYSTGGTLARTGPDTWTFTAGAGAAAEFSGGRVSREWAGGVPLAQFAWDDKGRLTSIGDGLEGGRTFALSYGEGCQGGGWEGFTLPADLWCAITYPDGSTSQAAYVEAGGAPRLGTVVDPGGVGLAWGWDAAGRLATLRDSSATAMASLDPAWGGAEFTNEVAYDADGRVESITAAAPSPGAARMRHAYVYPTGADVTASIVESTVEGGTAVPVPSLLGDEVGKGTGIEVTVEKDTWRVERKRDVDGLSTVATYDASGVLIEGTATDGRTVQVSADSEGLLKSSVGPFIGDASGAMKTSRTVDSTIVNPGQGADSATEPWTGLAAVVWPEGGSAVPQWWDSSVLGSELAADFDAAPSGAQTPWRAQATGLWRVEEEGRYRLVVTGSPETSVAVTVDGTRCTSLQGECSLPLSKGERAITVEIAVDELRGKGAFRVALEGGGGRIALADLRPNYNTMTRSVTNDNVNGRNFGTDIYVTDQPWSGQPSKVISAGNLATSYSYEETDANAGAFGRQRGATSPGGSATSQSYYGIDEQATDPCTNASYPQSGQMKTFTRYDGVTFTSVYDAVGRTIAVTAQGEGMSELACTAYDAAGRQVSGSTRTGDGQVIEELATVRTLSDGKVTTVDTITLGPGSPEGAGETFTSTSVTDLAGRTLESVDASGTRTTFAYAPDGALLRRDSWAPGADPAAAPTLALEFGYDPATGRATGVTANGTKLAEIEYDGRGQMAGATYPDGVSLSLAYDTAGSVSRAVVEADGRSYTTSRDRNAAGRTLASGVEVRDGKKPITQQEWDYDYDEAGRLVSAILVTTGDTADTGGRKRDFAYDFGKAPQGCFPGAGANLDRVGGARDGKDYETCRNEKGRLRWTTDPHLAPEDGRAEATYDGLGRLTQLSGAVPLEIAWAAGNQAVRITQGTSSTSWVVAGGTVQRMTTDGGSGPVTTRYGYVGGQSPVFILDDAGTVLDIRVGLPGGVLAHVGGASLALDIPDALGAAFVTTVGGVPTGAHDSALAPRGGPYGEPLLDDTVATSALTGIGPGTTFGFQAIAANPTISGHHSITMTARPYHPWLGEFLAADPAAGVSSTDYGYGDGNPVDKPDYSGAFGVWEWVGTAGGIVAAIAGIGTGAFMKSTTSKGWKVFTGVVMGAGIVAGAVGTTVSALNSKDSQDTEITAIASIVGTVVALIGVGSYAYKNRSAAQVHAGQNANQDVPNLQQTGPIEDSIKVTHDPYYSNYDAVYDLGNGNAVTWTTKSGEGTVFAYQVGGVQQKTTLALKFGTDDLTAEAMITNFVLKGGNKGWVPNDKKLVKDLTLQMNFWWNP